MTVGSNLIHGSGQCGCRSLSAQLTVLHFAVLFLDMLLLLGGSTWISSPASPNKCCDSAELWLPRRGLRQGPCACPFPTINMQLPQQMSPLFLPSQPSPQAGITPFSELSLAGCCWRVPKGLVGDFVPAHLGWEVERQP